DVRDTASVGEESRRASLVEPRVRDSRVRRLDEYSPRRLVQIRVPRPADKLRPREDSLVVPERHGPELVPEGGVHRRRIRVLRRRTGARAPAAPAQLLEEGAEAPENR